MEEKNAILKAKNAALETENENLKAKIKRLKHVIDDMIENDTEQILDYFNCCGSIRETASKYGMEMEELYERISVWDSSYDALFKSGDFEECRIEVVGRQECDKELDQEELLSKTQDIDSIIADYKGSEMSLYQLADKYELKIDYLFQMLKNNGIIEKETDAKGYAVFYREHLGAGSIWDGKSEFGFLKAEYKNDKPEEVSSSEQKCCCQTVTDIKCPDCNCFICEDCWIHKTDYAAQIDDFFCEDCYKNRDPTIRGTCISCEYIDNLEEGAGCNNCDHWVCMSCVSYKDDGNYYCVDC